VAHLQGKTIQQLGAECLKTSQLFFNIES